MSEIYEVFNCIVLLSPGLLISFLVIFLTVNYMVTIGYLFLVLVRLNILNRHRIFPNDHVRLYLLAVIRLERIIIGQNCDSYNLVNNDLPIRLIRINTILTTIFFSSLQLGTRFPTKLRIFLLWVTYFEIVLVQRTS